VIAGGLARATEVSEDAQKLMGIETSGLAAKSLPPEMAVFGSVLSPAPVIDLIRQIDTARATIKVSKEALERVEKLYSAGELVARKEVDGARAQQTLDRAVLRSLEDRLALEWGPWFSRKSPEERLALADELLAGHLATIRLSVPRGGANGIKPVAVRLHAFGQDQSTIRGNVIFPALAVDAAFQATSFVTMIDTPESPLAVGLSLTGQLETAGKPREGVLIPKDAVVFYLGKAWVYQQAGDEDFERMEIPIDTPVAGGWFLSGDAEKPGKVVVKGVQAILSQETLGPAEEE